MSKLEEIKEHIRELKRFTKGKMPLIVGLENKEEYELYMKARQGIKGIKNIKFEIDQRERKLNEEERHRC